MRRRCSVSPCRSFPTVACGERQQAASSFCCGFLFAFVPSLSGQSAALSIETTQVPKAELLFFRRTNGTDYESNCGNHPGNLCCGKPCPGPPAGLVFGGQLFQTTGGPATNLSFDGLSGIAAADAICASQAAAAIKLSARSSDQQRGGADSGSRWGQSLAKAEAEAEAETEVLLLPAAHYKALLADEEGCDGEPCRRASVTPGVGDGAIDWVIAPNAFYTLLSDNSTLVTVSNASRCAGKLPLAFDVLTCVCPSLPWQIVAFQMLHERNLFQAKRRFLQDAGCRTAHKGRERQSDLTLRSWLGDESERYLTY